MRDMSRVLAQDGMRAAVNQVTAEGLLMSVGSCSASLPGGNLVNI